MTNAMKKRENNALARVERTFGAPMFSPNVDILENADELTLVADVPGVTPDSIDIQYEQGELTIRGRVEPRGQHNNFLLNEYGVGDFYRVFQLGEGVDNDKISAEVAHGVLTVHLPKLERVKPRKIAVKGALFTLANAKSRGPPPLPDANRGSNFFRRDSTWLLRHPIRLHR